ncbi:Dor1-like protein [Fragilaria crotonensis]|nr:Dor1-like protein [Fragilaria crotonensis]
MADLLLSPAPGDLDERLVAKAALEAAEEQLRSLCATHAATFVAVERRGAALAQALADLLSKIKEVEPEVANVQQALEEGNSLADLSEKHRVRRRTLLQHSSLLELLELPSLMDACVRSNLYEEALSIASFSNTLERRHLEKNSVVLRVISQIRSRQSDLRRHLLFRLKQSVTMPQCLEVVTALRRLNSIDLEGQQQDDLHDAAELKLQIDFLEARDAWLDSTPRTAASASVAASEQVLDTIERYRTRVFEIATQFNAIFRASPGKKGAASSSSLLSMWVTRRVHSFLNMLSYSLNRMEDSASLRDALEACVFFATSMGRLGGDFTSMLSELFEPKMASLVMIHWKEGVSTLQETLKVCRDAGVASPLTSSNATSAVATPSPEQPPRQLLTLPPLARLVNMYLTGLNELRRCLLPGIFGILRKELHRSLSNVKALLETNQRAVNAPGLRGEATQLRELATIMLNTFDKVIEPYIRGALEVALGDYAAAKKYLKEDLAVEPEEEQQEAVDGEERTDVDETAHLESPDTNPYEAVGEQLAAEEAKCDVPPAETTSPSAMAD